MKRYFLFVAIIWLVVLTVTAQAQQMKVEYKNQIDSTLTDLEVQYYKMMGVQSFRLTLRGDFNGKRALIKKVSCNKGVFTEEPMLKDFTHLIFCDSIETLDFMAMPKGSDSIRIACFYPMSFNLLLFEDILPIGKMKILLETLTAGEGPETPLIAYSTGIPMMDGAATWFCGLRESGVAPRQWHEKYGIDGYEFYTIMLEDDTPPSDSMPIYQQIAKTGSSTAHPIN
jgi:hypothetical protein